MIDLKFWMPFGVILHANFVRLYGSPTVNVFDFFKQKLIFIVVKILKRPRKRVDAKRFSVYFSGTSTAILLSTLMYFLLI